MEESCVTNLDIGLNLQPPCRIIAHNWSVTQTNKNCDNMPETTNIILPQEAAFKQDDLVGTKKHGARRNPWGNLSYADLIAKAIESSVEKRLTLAQIYDWIVLNVPYFRDKGDNNSAAGWKNSIRHNLSLHSRFVRVLSDGTGKCSWWTVNANEHKVTRNIRRRSVDQSSRQSKSMTKRNFTSQPVQDDSYLLKSWPTSITRNDNSHCNELLDISNATVNSQFTVSGSGQSCAYASENFSRSSDSLVHGKCHSTEGMPTHDSYLTKLMMGDAMCTMPFDNNDDVASLVAPYYSSVYKDLPSNMSMDYMYNTCCVDKPPNNSTSKRLPSLFLSRQQGDRFSPTRLPVNHVAHIAHNNLHQQHVQQPSLAAACIQTANISHGTATSSDVTLATAPDMFVNHTSINSSHNEVTHLQSELTDRHVYAKEHLFFDHTCRSYQNFSNKHDDMLSSFWLKPSTKKMRYQGELDFSLQEVKVSGLECDIGRILCDGNFDTHIEF